MNSIVSYRNPLKSIGDPPRRAFTRARELLAGRVDLDVKERKELVLHICNEVKTIQSYLSTLKRKVLLGIHSG